MKEIPWTGLNDFLPMVISQPKSKDEMFLFRGQPCNSPLLPKIARKDPLKNTSVLEMEMLSEFRLRGARFLIQDMSDLDLLAIAQHHGMATRLLDWTTNPLVALWFSCINKDENNSHFYIYRASKQLFFDQDADKDIFNLPVTKIFRPKLNNPRIIAQQGWFSLHNYRQNLNGEGLYTGFDKDILHFIWLWHVEIPANEKIQILLSLNSLGINYESLFPDIDGLCKNINFMHESM